MVSTYAPCPDITATVTPDLECPEGEGQLLWVSLGQGQCRLGGSALAQCYSQIGDVAPDLDHPEQLVSTFRVVQKLLAGGYICTGGTCQKSANLWYVISSWTSHLHQAVHISIHFIFLKFSYIRVSSPLIYFLYH